MLGGALGILLSVPLFSGIVSVMPPRILPFSPCKYMEFIILFVNIFIFDNNNNNLNDSRCHLV